MVLVIAEHKDGKLKKASFEAVTFGAQVATTLGVECKALVIGDVESAGSLGKSGAAEVLHVAGVQAFDDQVYATLITDVARQQNARLVVLNHSSVGKAILGRVAVRWDASSASIVESLNVEGGKITIRRPAYSGKAVASVLLNGNRSVISLMPNAVQPAMNGESVSVMEVEVEIPSAVVTIREEKLEKGRVPLPEAELVVSAGRGLKDPSNWGIIEDLAKALGATTACSRPVADSDWRPHHEHVGQTGTAIRPNLYIAIGISGAIQHLAGVNNSKVIVVINKDQEAPFFKAADYGVLGDLFDVVPKLTEAVQRFKNS
jgi:electron transfer flavoprotein alpha subunit